MRGSDALSGITTKYLNSTSVVGMKRLWIFDLDLCFVAMDGNNLYFDHLEGK